MRYWMRYLFLVLRFPACSFVMRGEIDVLCVLATLPLFVQGYKSQVRYMASHRMVLATENQTSTISNEICPDNLDSLVGSYGLIVSANTKKRGRITPRRSRKGWNVVYVMLSKEKTVLGVCHAPSLRANFLPVSNCPFECLHSQVISNAVRIAVPY